MKKIITILSLSLLLTSISSHAMSDTDAKKCYLDNAYEQTAAVNRLLLPTTRKAKSLFNLKTLFRLDKLLSENAAKASDCLSLAYADYVFLSDLSLAFSRLEQLEDKSSEELPADISQLPELNLEQ